MIKEAIELIQTTAVNAKAIGKRIEVNDDILIWNGSSFDKAARAPAKRNHQVLSVPSFIEACATYGSCGTIWHNDDEVVLVVDDEKRDETVTLRLNCTSMWECFVSGFAGSPIASRRYLKRSLGTACPSGIPSQFGKVNFSRRSDGKADVSHQKESLGRSVENEVSATDELPEEIPLSIPVYETAGIRDHIPVLMAVDIDFERQQFCFGPVADEVAKGLQVIHARLNEILADTGLTVFYGSP